MRSVSVAVLGLLLSAAPMVAQSASIVERADSLVRAGRPWRATMLLAQSAAPPQVNTAATRIVAARAAAAWGGWTQALQITRDVSFAGTPYAGEAFSLAARAELETNVSAVSDARNARIHGADPNSTATADVLLARAYDRANERDSAALHYRDAALHFRTIGDWLTLRAAGVTTDSASRAKLFAQVAGRIARARVSATDAQARERAGDLAGAARSFRKAGDEVSAFRVEALAARDSMHRGALVRAIVAYIASNRNSQAVKAAVDIVDQLDRLTRTDELSVASASEKAGAYTRAVIGYTRAAASGLLLPADAMAYANALARSGKAADAIRVYVSVTTDAALTPLAAYQRARLLVQAGSGDARSALRAVLAQFPGVMNAAAPALFLQADLQVDAGDITGAIESLKELIGRFPSAQQAPLAQFRLGVLQWDGAPAVAARTWDSLAARYPRDEEALAARYWAARAYARMGNTELAQTRWKAIVQQTPTSYYGFRAAGRLGAPAWSPPAGDSGALRHASIDSAVQRSQLLRTLGLDVEAKFEIDAIADRATANPAEAATVAQALMEAGESARAIRIAIAALDRGVATRALYRLSFPILHDDALVEESARNQLDPAVVAGLIRQESSWNPRAVSVASARGLMQILPNVGASLAASKHYPLWNVALLFEPDVSLELGTAHLASSLRKGSPLARALAAYNAGGSRLARWLQRPGVDDDELFTEWIPFNETRDYVRIVERNANVYRALYNLNP